MGLIVYLCFVFITFATNSYQTANDFTEPPVIIEYDEDTDFTEPPVIIEYDNIEKKDAEIIPRDFLDTNPDEVNGEQMYQGDMLLSVEQRRALLQRKAISSLTSRWPKGSDGYPFVPYAFGDTSVSATAVLSGINYWMEHTCIKFERTTNLNQPYLRFIRDSGCYSYVGRLSSNGQPVSIGNGCEQLGIVVHEIGHAIGFFHEQSDSGRDNYVHINQENLDPNVVYNFRKESDNDYGVEYDYTSIMHYGSKAFSTNGKMTIATKDPMVQGLLGQRSGLSHRDKLLANTMYNCTGIWMDKCGLSLNSCENGGYIGINCNCVCPPGTSGTNCQTVTGGYYDEILDSCSEKITEEGQVNSPNYPGNYPAGTQCTKLIEAPECHVARLTFNAFRLYGRNPYCYGGRSCCYFDSLEVRTDNTQYLGDVYCDRDDLPIFTSSGREMVLYFQTMTNYYSGWSATLSFVPVSGCQPNTPDTTTTTTTRTTTQPTTTTTQTTTWPTTTTTQTTTQPTTTQTTTIFTETTSISTESTSTEASNPECLIEQRNGIYYWSSPNYGTENYPNDFSCGIVIRSFTTGITVKMQNFNLQPRVNKQCVDYVKFNNLYGRTKSLCGRLRRPKQRVINAVSDLRLDFSTNPSITRLGFNISIHFEPSQCVQTIYPDVGGSDIISTPNFNQPHATALMCAYFIIAPSGYQVKLEYLDVRTRRSTDCKKDWVVVNNQGQSNFPSDSSQIFCGRQNITSFPTSTSRVTLLAYKGSRRRSRGIQFKYTIV